jgi:hypothetical protein
MNPINLFDDTSSPAENNFLKKSFILFV